MANEKIAVKILDAHMASLDDTHVVLDFGAIWKTTSDRHSPKGRDKLKQLIRQFTDYASAHPGITFNLKMDSNIDDFPSGYVFWIFDYAYHVRNIQLPKKYCEMIAKEDQFSWEEIQACLDNRIPSKPGHLPCQMCGKPSEKLDWIDFSTPLRTWENLMGRMGAMSICPDCHRQVEFICVLLN